MFFKRKNTVLGCFFLLCALPFAALWAILKFDLPADFFWEKPEIVFFDRNQQELASWLSSEEKQKRPVRLENISPYFLKAVIAVEDKNFLKHFGIDLLATSRALFENILLGQIISGASTLSQQVAREYFGQDRKRTVFNKIEESLFALRLEKKLTKESILELWANRMSFGGNVIGVEAAAQNVFGKSAKNLDLAEAAFLAGIPQAPQRFHPLQKFANAKKRQEFVLARMQDLGFISEEEKNFALDEELFIADGGRSAELIAPHFVDWLQKQGSFQKNLNAGLVKMVTTLDAHLQKNINNLMRLHLEKLQNHHVQNAAVLVWDIETGEILAFVGNADFQNKQIQGEVNILAAARSVGSALKPFLYLLAFSELDWTPQTIIADTPSGFGVENGFFYEPQNYDLRFRGEINIRQALAESRNVPAVKTLEILGIPKFLNFLHKLRIETQMVERNDFGLSMALGSFPIPPIELAHAYGILARGGRNFSFRFLWQEAKNSAQEELFACADAFQIVDILSDHTARINSFGTKNPLNFPFAVAVKTGTSRNFEDNWAVGFSEQIGVLTWVGNADGSPMREVSGISGAGPLFAEVMEAAMKGRLQNKSFTEKVFCKNSTQKERLPTNPAASADISQTGEILRPINGQTFFLSAERPLEHQKLELSATQESEWFVSAQGADAKKVGTGKNIFWLPQVGQFTITAKSQFKESRVQIEVKM